jgi:hypothetical protein
MAKPLNARRRWELEDLKRACTVFFDRKLNEVFKAQIYRDLGRTSAAVATIAYAVRGRATGQGRNRPFDAAYTEDQARYCLGLQDTPFPPRPRPPEPRAEEPAQEPAGPEAVEGDPGDPETTRRVMAMVKFELGKQSSDLLLEQAATLESILGVLGQIAGQLETQTQLLSDLAAPVEPGRNGAVGYQGGTPAFRRRIGRG